MRFGRMAALVAAGVATALALTACGPALIRVEEPSTSEAEAVPVGKAEAIEARLDLGVGEMTVRGGASDAMNATFDYRPHAWKPRVEQSVEGTTVVVRVDQPDVHVGLTSSPRNKWDVRFNDSLPLKLRVETGVGKSTLDLAGLKLQRLDVQGGVGETRIDLGSEVEQDLDMRVDGGVGEITVIVPKSAGVRIAGVHDGIGDWKAEGFMEEGDNSAVNAAYATAPVKIVLNITRGVGDVRIEQR